MEYGDYLVVTLDDDIVTAFAVCVDHPDPRFNVWSNSITHVHGYLELALICAIRPNQAKPLFDMITQFARDTLLRYFVKLQSLNIPKLKAAYRSWGLVEKDRKNHMFEFNLTRTKKTQKSSR
jgi:hypothetical protein